MKPLLILKNYFPRLVAILLALTWMLCLFELGIGLTIDSVNYLSFAIIEATQYKLAVTPIWPPLYPLLLAVILKFGLSPLQSTCILSGIFLTGSLLCFVQFASKFTKSSLLTTLALVAMATSQNFIFVFAHAWSEQAFSFFLLVFFYLLWKNIQSENPWYFIALCSSASLTALSRYAGYVTLLVLFFYGLFQLVTIQKKNKATPSFYLFWFLLSCFPSTIYLLRNKLLFSSFHGTNRGTGTGNFFFEAKRLALTIYQDVPTGLLIFLGTALVSHLISNTCIRRRIFITCIYLFVFLYLALLSYSGANVDLGPSRTRYLMPIYPIFYILPFVGFANVTFKSLLHQSIQLSLCLYLGFVCTQNLNTIKQITERFTATDNTLTHNRFGFAKTTVAKKLRQKINTYIESTKKPCFALLLHPDFPVLDRSFVFQDALFPQNTKNPTFSLAYLEDPNLTVDSSIFYTILERSQSSTVLEQISKYVSDSASERRSDHGNGHKDELTKERPYCYLVAHAAIVRRMPNLTSKILTLKKVNTRFPSKQPTRIGDYYLWQIP